MPLITNVMGATAAELIALVEACDERAEIAALELNVSCPNVKTGLDIGADPDSLRAVVAEVRPRTRKPLIVKLTPNTADVAACAQAAEQAGADAVSLINTLRAMALAPEGGVQARRPVRGWAAARADCPVPRSGPSPSPRSRPSPSEWTMPVVGHGRRAERRARARAAGRGRHARRRGHRELPRSGRGARIAAGLP